MSAQQKTSKAITVSLWIAQVLLAATFVWAGSMKLFKPDGLPFPWIKNNPGLVLLTGVVDLLGGIGILLPALLRIRPVLTVFAAYGIIALMAIAITFHVSRGEAKNIGFNIFVLSLAAFVAWGRQKGPEDNIPH